VFVRPNAARADAYWGPLIARYLSARGSRGDFISHWSGAVVLTAQQIDMYIVDRDPLDRAREKSKLDTRGIGWVGIVYGHPPFDPLVLQAGSGKPLFAPPLRLPTGVLVFPPHPAYQDEYGAFAPTLFITPDGTCIVTEQVSAPRVQNMLAANPTPPPPLTAAPESLGGVTFGVTTLRFVNGGRQEKNASFAQGMVAAGFGLRGGAGGAVEGYADYSTSEDATNAYGAVQRTCAQRTDQCILDPSLFRDAKLEQSGNRLVMTLVFSDKLLQSIQSLQP
jgi:hypothetical protein